MPINNGTDGPPVSDEEQKDQAEPSEPDGSIKDQAVETAPQASDEPEEEASKWKRSWVFDRSDQ